MLNGGNVAALRHNKDQWEIVQFQSAQLIAPNSYELTGLLRGQCGTEALAAQPVAAGASFVLLNQAVVPVELALTDLRRPQTLTLMVAGRPNTDASRLDLLIEPYGMGLLPFAPVHVVARRTQMGVQISFSRRTRVSGDSWEMTDVPLGEDESLFEIDIHAQGSIKRTLSTLSTTVLYPLTQELADFASLQTSLDLTLVQLSPVIGRGHPHRQSVAVHPSA